MGISRGHEGFGVGDELVMNEHRLSPEFRVDESGRSLTGRVLAYGDVADMGAFRETFAPRAFVELPQTINVNLQHDPDVIVARDAVLADHPRELRVRALLPEGSAAVQLVKRRSVDSFSIEFHALKERRENGIRVIERAILSGLALVDRGAYPQSKAEIRRRGGGGRGSRGGRLGTFRGRVPKGKRLECRCSPGSCKSALFKSGSFDSLFDDEDVRDVLAVAGDYSQAIGSRNRKSVRFWEGRNGDLEFAVDVPNTDRGKALMETYDVTNIYARPVIDVDASDVKITGELAEYSSARVRALTIGPTDAAAGWTPLRLRDGDDDDKPAQRAAVVVSSETTSQRRARVWL